MSDDGIKDLVERSSLGTPEAKALRASVSDERAARVVARSKEFDEWRQNWADAAAASAQHPADYDAAICPKCGGIEWATASDGLGDVASVAAVCVGCGYLTTSVVDMGDDPTETPSGEVRR